jgi:DNA polymerase III alpha subunit (gram-positive type)
MGGEKVLVSFDLTDYSSSVTVKFFCKKDKFDEITNEQLAVNRLLNDQLSNIGLAIPSNGITHQFLMKHNDVLSEDIIDLISYSNDLDLEEKRIEKKIS